VKKYKVSVEEYKECNNTELKYYETMPKLFIAFLVLISLILPSEDLEIGLEK
jgi:hypothetical protein